MTIQIRRLEITIATAVGQYGLQITFNEGLVIIRAENTSGKSNCLQAIVYALGLEGALGPNRMVPLGPVMTRAINTDQGEQPVLESNIYLEVSNHRSEVITVQRSVVGNRDRRLVTVWEGPKLSNPGGPYKMTDYYVGIEGAAVRERGFHHFFASFIGWTLPEVPRFQGGASLLYLEAIFPLFFVEQKRGWAAIQSNLPTYLGIRDMGKRAIEFVLNLDAYRIQVRRQQIQEEEARLKASWSGTIAQAQGIAMRAYGRVISIPTEPIVEWPPKAAPEIQVIRDGEWMALTGAAKEVAQDIEAIVAQEIPATNKIIEQADQDLKETYETLFLREEAAAELLRLAESDRADASAIGIRLNALEEDLKHYRDIERVQSLGSLAELAVVRGHCPTCTQPVNDTLFNQVQKQQPMTIEQNIAFIRDQIKTFKSLREGAVRQLQENEIKLAALQGELDRLRAKLRDLQQTLISDGRVPSYMAIRRRMTLEGDAEKLSALGEDIRVVFDQFVELSSEWKTLMTEKATLPKEGLSANDKTKLSALEKILREQEIEYGFSSFDPNLLQISPETYKPTREGYDIGHEASASDNVRIIWGYLQGLLELSRTVELNHLGVLILDEPRQQDARLVSFEKFAARAATAASHSQQVIFATSESKTDIAQIASRVKCQVVNFDGYLFSRL